MVVVKVMGADGERVGERVGVVGEEYVLGEVGLGVDEDEVGVDGFDELGLDEERLEGRDELDTGVDCLDELGPDDDGEGIRGVDELRVEVIVDDQDRFGPGVDVDDVAEPNPDDDRILNSVEDAGLGDDKILDTVDELDPDVDGGMRSVDADEEACGEKVVDVRDPNDEIDDAKREVDVELGTRDDGIVDG